MTLQTDKTGVPADVVERVRKAQQARDRADKDRMAKASIALRERYRAERSKVVPAEVEAKLATFASAWRAKHGATLNHEEQARRRAEELAFAAEQGVDVAALARLTDDFATRFGTVMLPRVATDSEVTELPAGQASAEQRVGGWNGEWDPGYEYWTTNAGHTSIWNAESYWLPSHSRVGSNIRYRSTKTDDSDDVSLKWRNGYMVLYTPPRTARLFVDIFLTCLLNHFFVDTDDEPGTSSCNVRVGQYASAEIYSNWADELPVGTVSSSTLAQNGTTSTERWLDYSPVAPAARRHVRVYSSAAFPAGFPVAVFASERNEAVSWLNDTRVTAGVNAAWVMDDVRVGVV